MSNLDKNKSISQEDKDEVANLREEQLATNDKVAKLQDSVASMANIVLKPVLPADTPDIAFNELQIALNINEEEEPTEDGEVINPALSNALENHPDFRDQLKKVVAEVSSVVQENASTDGRLTNVEKRVNDV